MKKKIIINEYTFVIKREKGKVKILESTHAKLELAHSDIVICCSTSASQEGFDLAVTFPLRDAQRCRLRLFNQH